MPNRRDHSQKLNDFARGMRAEPSNPERRLWFHLRGHRLDGYKFRRQVPIAGRIVDFACLGEMLIVEADGSQHYDVGVEERDAHRDADLARLGWKTLRFSSLQVLKETDAVLRTILAEFDDRNATLHSPSPQPPPASGRGS